jgi:uncharacterized phage protein gp47/JayE
MSIPIDKSLEDIRTDMFARLNEVQDEYAANGWLPVKLNLNKGVFRGLVEMWCWGLLQLYKFLAYVLQQGFPSLSGGAWLDLHCRQVGVERLPATRTIGVVRFIRDDSSGNVSIPAGRVVKTRPDGAGVVYRYLSTSEVVLPDGSSEVDVPVQAEEYGAASNAVAGQIVDLVTPVTGVDRIENSAGWITSEGADRETDVKLRERYVLAWMSIGGATRTAYEGWARSVAGVVAATCLGHEVRGPGMVDVVVRGTAGIPSEDLLASVDAVVQEKRPVNDNVLVRGPVSVPVAIEGELVLTGGDPEVIVSDAMARITAMFTDPAPVEEITPLKIGESLTMHRLIAEIMAVDGIKKINFISPVADLDVPVDGLAVLDSMTFTTIWG